MALQNKTMALQNKMMALTRSGGTRRGKVGGMSRWSVAASAARTGIIPKQVLLKECGEGRREGGRGAEGSEKTQRDQVKSSWRDRRDRGVTLLLENLLEIEKLLGRWSVAASATRTGIIPKHVYQP